MPDLEPDLRHVVERLWLAVEDLATSDEPLRERALRVYDEQLSVLIPKEFDTETRADFEKLQALAGKLIESAAETAAACC